MPAYFFHYRTPLGALLPDHIGSEHGSDDSAVTEAVLTAADLIRGGSTFTRGGAFEIHDEAGWLVDTVPVWRH